MSKKWICPVCGEDFDTEASLIEHMDKEHPQSRPLTGEDFKAIEPKVFPKLRPAGGLYLVPPHARLIVDRKKTLIIKTVSFEKYVNKPLFLIEDNLCYGLITYSRPREIDKEEFDKEADKHRITPEEFKKWNWEDKKLFSYDFKINRMFESPIKVKIPIGPQVFITLPNIKFEKRPRLIWFAERLHTIKGWEDLTCSKALEELLDPKRFRAEGIDDDMKNKEKRWMQLLSDHRYLHIGWYRLKAGKKWGDWTKDLIIKYHAAIIDTLRSIYFPMYPKEVENV